MSALKRMPLLLVLLLGLAGGGCGDDDSNDNEGNTAGDGADGDGADGDGADGDGGNGAGECTGGYPGVTAEQISANLADENGACANDGDIAGVCTEDPSAQAREIGLACFLTGKGSDETAFRSCVLEGDENSEGLIERLSSMSADCVGCYADAVICSANNCAAPCQSTDEACAQCRDEKGCTKGFFDCSGLKPVEEIK